MSPEPKNVPEVSSEGGLGSLRGCLVEGNAEQQARERRVRRHALVISVLLQSAVLTVLFLIPLLSKAERISLNIVTPIPPYGHPSNHSRNNTRATTNRRPANPDSRFIFHPPTNVVNPHPVEQTDPGDPIVESPSGTARDDGPGCSWCVDIGSKNSGPKPPPQTTETSAKPQIVHMTTIDPAMLIRRVEPVYPVLARQTHREGRVELRAIIGTDGTIQSLQIVASDPLFDISAREAVQQWRYKPTILNGKPVEIDTYITVVYTTQH